MAWEKYRRKCIRHCKSSFLRNGGYSYDNRFAGSDTTAIAMRACLYYLLKDPATYAQLQQEIDSATTDGRLSSPPKYSEAIELPLLCASIKEGMRLHPSVGLTMPRIAPKGGMTLCGQYIPEGYSVGMNGAVVHYDKGIFGPDADRFRPHRWLEGDAKTMDKYMLHFGAGTRTCVGKNVCTNPPDGRAYMLTGVNRSPSAKCTSSSPSSCRSSISSSETRRRNGSPTTSGLTSRLASK